MRLLVVCGSAAQISFFWLVVAQDRSPAAGAGIAEAGAVGDELELSSLGEHRLGDWKNASTRSRIAAALCVVDRRRAAARRCARRA